MIDLPSILMNPVQQIISNLDNYYFLNLTIKIL